MKKILLLLGVVVLVALCLMRPSFAYFGDVETSEGNIITAGTTDLQVVGEVDFYFEFDKRTIKRGASGTATIELSNAGSTDGVADLRIMDVVNHENGCKKGEKKVDETCGDLEGELGAYLLVTITYNSATIVNRQPLDSIACINHILGDLGAGETATVSIAWELPGGVSKSIESDSVSFCTEFSLGW